MEASRALAYVPRRPPDSEQRVRRRHWPWFKPRHTEGPRVDNALARGGVMMDTVRLCPAVYAAAAAARE